MRFNFGRANQIKATAQFFSSVRSSPSQTSSIFASSFGASASVRSFFSASTCCCRNAGRCGCASAAAATTTHAKAFSSIAKRDKRAAAGGVAEGEALAKALEEEIQLEMEEINEESQGSNLAKGILSQDLQDLLNKTNFRLSSDAGSSVVQFEKQCGNEHITIAYNIESAFSQEENYMEEEEGEASEESFGAAADEDQSFNITVTIKRQDSGDALVADAWLHSSNTEVLSLRYVARKAESIPEHAYDCPDLSNLDEKLQATISKYIASKGANSDLYEFLFAHAPLKESSEYVGWLQNVKKFISK